MNYRSAVVIGPGRAWSRTPTSATTPCDLIVDHVVPGRSATLRANTRKELAATAVIAVPLAEASVKARAGGPADEAEDVAAGVWAGVVPLRGHRRRRSSPTTRARSPTTYAVGSPVGSAGEPLDRVRPMERTLVLVKPDGVRRGLTGEVIRRIEAKGYRLVRLELREATRELLAEHYAEHEGKPFYEPLVEFMLSGPVVAMVVEGERCIEGFRSLAGATDPTVAAPGTIRGDLGRDWGLKVQQNLVHGSDSPESAEREIGIWFPQR